jgi:DNA invertase Pin-like site-specific DNA recombinase
MTMSIKAVSYLRCSGMGQTTGDTWERQQEAIRRYASGNDIEIMEEFRDEGISGTTEMQNRLGLGACMARVESNGVTLVLVESPDRLARDSMVSELIVREFQKLGIRVISANGGVDLTAGDNDNPTAKLVRQILAAVAEFDKCMIVLKTRAARDRLRARNGRCEGRKPYGSRVGEDKILQDIYLQSSRGMGPKMIAQWLNSNGIPSRYGKWYPGTISKLLSRRKIDQRLALTG